MSDHVCRGCWQLGNNCGRCVRCRREATAALAERDELRRFAGEYADFVEEQGWHQLAAGIRERLRLIARRHEVTR